VLNANTGTLIEHIDTSTEFGFVNSVAVHNGIAALAIEAATEPSRVSCCCNDTRTRWRWAIPITVGALPDMLTFTHDGRQLLVANEAHPTNTALASEPRYLSCLAPPLALFPCR